MPIPEEWLHSRQIAFGDVRRRLEGAALTEQHEILGFIRHHTDRIWPQPDSGWLYDQMCSYLLECISRGLVEHDDADDASVHFPFEAAHELVVWFNWYRRSGDVDSDMVRRVVDRIEALFRDGDAGVRNCLETGFLEHVLEAPDNREYFAQWAHDPLLKDSYTEALRWGLAHAEPRVP